MRVRWTPAAASDFEQISDYLKQHHPRYRHSTVRKLFSAIESLRKSPSRGRAGREEGTRELLLQPLPYIILYRVTEQTIEVLRVYHIAQDRFS